MKTQIAHADAEHLSVERLGFRINNAAEAGSEEHVAGEEEKARIYRVMGEYLSQFAATEMGKGGFAGTIRCLCGEMLDGMLGTFTWGIAHGEGSCSSCGWPARGIHYVEDENGDEVLTLRLALPWHPDNVREPQP